MYQEIRKEKYCESIQLIINIMNIHAVHIVHEILRHHKIRILLYFIGIQEKKAILKMCLKMKVTLKNFVSNLDQNLMDGKDCEM